MTSKTKKPRTTLEEYIPKILDDINVRSKVPMKSGFTGKIRNQFLIAKSLGTHGSNSTLRKSLKFAVEQEWLIYIKTRKDLNTIFVTTSRYRSDYEEHLPAYVLTERGINFAKAVKYITNYKKLSDMLDSIISDEASNENLEQIKKLFFNYENPFLELRKLKFFDIPDD
jgi:hypothetical protein